MSLLPFVVLIAPPALVTLRRFYRWAWDKSGGVVGSVQSFFGGSIGGAVDSFVPPLPAGWERWNGARPELRGAPKDTILNYAGLSKTTPEFRKALLDTAEELGIPVDSLALIMSHESGFNPAALNPLPAAGLIQLTVQANLKPFTNKDAVIAITKMPAIQQLRDVVIPYYLRFGDKAKGADPGKLLMDNFLPAEAGKPESTVLGVKDEVDANGAPTFKAKVYSWNAGMDVNHDGQITIGDVYQDTAAIAKRAKGERIRIDGSTWTPGDTGASSSAAGAAVSSMTASPPKKTPAAPAASPAPSTVTGGTSAHRPDSAPSGGITLAAVLDGSAVIPDEVNLTLPSGLSVPVFADAIFVPWEGSGWVRFPVSYADVIVICNKLDCLPLTKEISDLVWQKASIHLRPIPLVITPADAALMATVGFSLKHDLNLINPANNSKEEAFNPGAFVADVGKDWLLDPGVLQSGAVNYGWRTLQGVPLQSLGHAHNAQHYDYSQVCRLMRRKGFYQGQTVNLLERPELWLPAGFPGAMLAPFKGA